MDAHKSNKEFEVSTDLKKFAKNISDETKNNINEYLKQHVKLATVSQMIVHS